MSADAGTDAAVDPEIPVFPANLFGLSIRLHGLRNVRTRMPSRKPTASRAADTKADAQTDARAHRWRLVRVERLFEELWRRHADAQL
jgi:hypothetical protein